MTSPEMTKDELLVQLADLRKRVAVLERLEDHRLDEIERLKQSSNMLQSLLHCSSDPMVVYDAEGCVLFLNASFSATFGWSNEELEGQRIDYVPEDCLAQARETLERTLRGQQVPAFDTRRLTKDGRILDVHISSALFRNSLGEPVGHIVTLRDLTETRRTELALRESEEKYRRLVETASDMIYQSDSRGIVTFANQLALKVTGYLKEEFIGKHYLEFIHAETRAQAERFYSIQFVKRLPTTYQELPVLTKQGETIWVGQNVQLMMDGDMVIGFQAIAREITERKRVELALVESERRFREVLEKVDLLAATIDPEGQIIFCNDFLLRLTDLQREEILGRNWFEVFVGEKERETRLKAHLEFMKEGSIPVHRENTIVKKDGSPLWIRWTNTLLHDLDGKVIGTTGIGEDITEKKKADEALRESEKKYRKILETIADGYHETDLKGNLTLVNDSLCRILDYPREELVGLGYRQLMDEHNAKLVFNAYNEVYRTGKSNPGFSYQMIRKDGHKRDVVVSVALVRDEEGNPSGFRGIFRDITKQKLLEEQLRHAAKMEAVGRLAGGIAHDFNNLLTAIMGYSSLLTKQISCDSSSLEKLEQISSAAERAAALTKQLLAFSRKQVLSVKIFDINAVIVGLEGMLRRLIGEDIELVTICSEPVGRAEGDPAQIEQIILNLAINARDAMPKGGKLILETGNATVDPESALPVPAVAPGAYVTFAVTDTGHGMDRETMVQVFEPFFTTKEKGIGTGLGLSTVYGIVKQHGGYIAVNSKPGTGTAFKVYLPRVEGEVEKAVLPRSTAAHVFGQETILVVEDDAIVRNLACELLELMGYVVLSASDPHEAKAACVGHEGDIDLLLTDVVLPHMDGRSLFKTLSPSRPNMKVLYVSGYTQNYIAHRGILEPGLHFLEKPFTVETLSKKVREVLDLP